MVLVHAYAYCIWMILYCTVCVLCVWIWCCSFVLQLGRSISIARIGRAYECNRNWVKLIAQKPLANEMTFAHCLRCSRRAKEQVSMSCSFFIIVLVAVVIFYSIGIISSIRLSYFMGIELFFRSLALSRSLPIFISQNENVNANNNKSDTNIISLTFLGMFIWITSTSNCQSF